MNNSDMPCDNCKNKHFNLNVNNAAANPTTIQVNWMNGVEAAQPQNTFYLLNNTACCNVSTFENCICNCHKGGKP